MEPLSTQVAEKNNRRRSQRVLLGLTVTVIGQTPDKKPLEEKTRTLVINAHGALVTLDMRVSIGMQLTLRNGKTNEEVACRVVYAGQQLSKAEVGLEFLKPAPNFWHIAFPPADWTPRSPEAKSSVSRPAVPPRPNLPNPAIKK
ncbi:MAG: PilZ domain-containing protein [Acidobacteriia bacterium]|nr:PilZ domain-containing protein [Terriglobia bacterium]